MGMVDNLWGYRRMGLWDLAHGIASVIALATANHAANFAQKGFYGHVLGSMIGLGIGIVWFIGIYIISRKVEAFAGRFSKKQAVWIFLIWIFLIFVSSIPSAILGYQLSMLAFRLL